MELIRSVLLHKMFLNPIFNLIIISSKYDVGVLMILFTATTMKHYDTQKYKGYATIKDNLPIPPRIITYEAQTYRNFTDRVTE